MEPKVGDIPNANPRTTEAAFLARFSRVYPAGHVVFEQGDAGSRMYIVGRGQVRIFRQAPAEEITLAVLGPGEFFGEMALLEGRPRCASARVERSATLIEIDSKHFVEMVRSNAEIAVRLMRKLSGRVRELDRRVQALYADPGLGRALELLAFLLPAEGPKLVAQASDLQRQVAEKTQITPHRLNAFLDELERAGCIARDDDKIEVFARDDLRDYASYLELRQRYDQAQVEASDTADRRIGRLLRALDVKAAEVEPHQTVLARQYEEYLRLSARFDPKGAE